MTSKIEKTIIPAIKIMRISDERKIYFDDKIFGKLTINVFNNHKNGFVEEYEIQVPDDFGENGDLAITVPEELINKTVCVVYRKEVEARVLNLTPEDWIKSISSGKVRTGSLTFYDPDARIIDSVVQKYLNYIESDLC